MANRRFAEQDPDQELQAERYQAEYESTEKRIELLKEKRDRKLARFDELVVRAPIRGTIPAINLEQKLDRRPVQRGERLFDVMDENGAWRLEVQLPDKRMGHLLRAIEEAGGTLEGEFSLLTEPDKQYPCTLKKANISTRTSVHAENGTIVELYVDPPADMDDSLKRIGAEVTVKLECGKTSLGYKLFGDVIDQWHKYTWF